MAAEPYQSLISVEEYLELERTSLDVRYEFIDGHVYMLAGGTANHSIIIVNMIILLSSLLRGGSCCVYNSDMRVRLSKSRYVYPDVSVSCDQRDRGEVESLQFPRLVVEVLSPSTEAHDRIRKSIYYRACPTIQEYVLVNTQRQAVEVYRREEDTLWSFSSFGPGDSVELVSLGVSLPLATIYQNVVLPEGRTSDSST